VGVVNILKEKHTNQFGRAAVRAVELYRNRSVADPLEVWQRAIAEFTDSANSRKKCCPKNTFLGLCSDELIVGIRKGDYLYKPESVERLYARTAVEYLKNHLGISISPSELWAAIGNRDKHHDSQMNVVLELWKNKLII
jgi:hypothetical protein